MPDDSQLALIHYRMLFPDVAALGPGNPPAAWKSEYDRVSASGLSATLITSNSYEGGSASAVKNFDQRIVLEALLIRRAELDPTFDTSAFEPPQVIQRRRFGFVVRLGC